MADIQIKRVYEPASPADGYRILVDRLWPRGVKKEALRFDDWAKVLAPSTDLRKWYHADPAGRRDEFTVRYLDELNHSPQAKEYAHTLEGKKTITLLIASKDINHAQAPALREWLKNQR